MTFYIGVDPGQSGAWAILDEQGHWIMSSLFAEADAFGTLIETIALFREDQRSIEACIEQVHSMPKQGVASTFKFGTNYGMWQGFFRGKDVPYELITPNRWMKAVLDSGGKDPNARLEFARRRWPVAPLKRKKDKGVADALCIAEYTRTRRQEKNGQA
ncbi:MAG TPA: hypothetical protein VJ521_08935 [Acidobacteriota bacterium]|nr:hypothetical protein [Acidobacteriota bacterium]